MALASISWIFGDLLVLGALDFMFYVEGVSTDCKAIFHIKSLIKNGKTSKLSQSISPRFIKKFTSHQK
jgi:hypothetical protein